MEGSRSVEGIRLEESAEVQPVYGLLRKATDGELWQLARLMAGKPDSQLFGQTEFEVRERVLRMGALALEAMVNDREKGGTQAVAHPCE